MNPRTAAIALAALVAASRFSHSGVVWVEEAYPIAAAAEMLRGRMLYRDIWFDKPPLFPALYMLFGAEPGWPLRVFSTILVLFICWWAFRLARELWSEREGCLAALLTGFYLTFGIPSAVMAAAPDLLLMTGQLAAIHYCVRGRPLAAGVWCGIGLLVNPKAVYVIAACLPWQWRSVARLGAGIAVVQAPVLLWLSATGALMPYWEQVYVWGFRYSADPPVAGYLAEGFRRTVNWAGFHATAVIAAVFCLRTDRRLLGWTLLSAAAVAAGWRFFPRYYLHLLVPICILAAHGLHVMQPRWRAAVLALMLVPAIRFGPGYVGRATGSASRDLALHDDARQAAGILRQGKAQSVLVWGYRPEVFAYSGTPAATRFLDSQPLTGVIADRHLTGSNASFTALSEQNRRELIQTRPHFIVDGLGPLNPGLAITQYPDLREWLSGYSVAATTAHTVIYTRRLVD